MRTAKTLIRLGAQPFYWFCHVVAHICKLYYDYIMFFRHFNSILLTQSTEKVIWEGSCNTTSFTVEVISASFFYILIKPDNQILYNQCQINKGYIYKVGFQVGE